MIVGNVEEYIERCLKSFLPFVDEVHLVSAIGNQKPDKTYDIAFKTVDDANTLERRVGFGWRDYKNAPEHADWPHLDNFAAARNESFKHAHGKYLFWADSDDVFGDGNAENTALMAEEVRKHAQEAKWPVYVFTYNIFGRGLELHRERMVRRGLCGWKYPVHECMDTPEGTQALQDDRIIITHLPHSDKQGSNPRNLRILESIPEDQMEPGLWYHLHGEYVFQKNEERAVWSAKKALEFGITYQESRNAGNRCEICDWPLGKNDSEGCVPGNCSYRPEHNSPEWHRIEEKKKKISGNRGSSFPDSKPASLGRPERYEIFMNLGKMAGLNAAQPQLGLAEDYFLQAFKSDPRRREALGLLTCNRIDAGQPDHALGYAQSMMGIERPKQQSWNDRAAAYEWLGVDIYCQALRVNGRRKEADRYRADVLAHAAKTRPVISLIHATRGRPRQASIARKVWFELAEHPEALDHIFVIDEDDKESVPLLRLHSLVVKPGGGCVRAWNMGAFNAIGEVIIQMSDDWMPPSRWDTLILERFRNNLPVPVLAENHMSPSGLSDQARESTVISRTDGHSRGGQNPSAFLSRPAVLAVSDGHRKDDLLCMAIMTTTYFRQDFFMFHPWFTGVYSDNYFSATAYRRKAVIEARDLVFNHDHPFFREEKFNQESRKAGKEENPSDSFSGTKGSSFPDSSSSGMDETYAIQNSPEAYEKGKAVYDQLEKRRDWSTVPGYCNYWSFYQQVAETLKDGDWVAEIGVWMGRSIILLAQECKRLGKKVKFLAVDNFKGESNQREHEDTIKLLKIAGTTLKDEFMRNIERCGVADMITVLHRDSHNGGGDCPDGHLAFCFIDAAHDEESVRRDIGAWLPKLRYTGVMAGHDAQHPPVIAAVKSKFNDKFDVVGPIWMAKKE